MKKVQGKNITKAVTEYFVGADNESEGSSEEENSENSQSDEVGYREKYHPMRKRSSPARSESETATSVKKSQQTKNIPQIFKTEKIYKDLDQFLGQKKKSSRKSTVSSKGDKLNRNKLSARKSRQKKKAYVNSLESRYIKLEAELKQMKKLALDNKNSVNCKISEIENMEREYFQLLTQGRGLPARPIQTEENKIKYFHNKMQSGLVVELYKDLIKTLVPLDIKYFELKCTNLQDIYKFDTIDEFYDILVQNQYVLDQSYNFQFATEATASFPFQVYMFYEHLKKMTSDFKEHVFQVRK
jgi:small-conductance mechanosensitive channel